MEKDCDMIYMLVLQGSLAQWQTVFFLSAGIYFSTDLFYVIFGTGVEQPWNKMASNESSVTAEIISKDDKKMIDAVNNRVFDGDRSE
jgi:hypothetical protein